MRRARNSTANRACPERESKRDHTQTYTRQSHFRSAPLAQRGLVESRLADGTGLMDGRDGTGRTMATELCVAG